jgi:PAS domain S-box-containing protein
MPPRVFCLILTRATACLEGWPSLANNIFYATVTMRENSPINNREIELRDDQVIVSRADVQGRITYVNADFIETSGYSEAELMGQPHNIVRHPDMPEEVFADLWADLKAGRPWIGLIKNRTKDGSSYWAEAHVSPVWERGEITGYLSMRLKASQEQIAAAESLYAKMRDALPSDFAFRHGQAVASGLVATLRSAFAGLPIQVKLILFSLLAALVVLSTFAGLLANNVSQTLDADAHQRLRHDVSLIRAAVSAHLESAQMQVDHHAETFSRRTYAALGGRSGASPKAIEALSHRLGRDQGNPINAFLTDIHGAASIFVRTPEGFQRRLTTAVNRGVLAVDTPLAADNPALQELLAGKPYRGVARVFDRVYMSNYTPIFDAAGKVVGATVVGIDLDEQMKGLKTELRTTKIATSGYYYIADATPGPEFGRLILHPYKEGHYIAEAIDERHRNLIAEMGRRASGEIVYFWKNVEAGETAERKKLIIFETLEHPRWVVAGGSSLDEFTALSGRIVWMVLAGSLAMAIAIFACILLLVRRLIISPLKQQVLPTFNLMASGRFDSHLDIHASDEMGRLLQSLECLQTRLAYESERERALARMHEVARFEAEALSNARAEFLANMSHEIRTPLNAVIGLAYLLRQGRLGPRETEYVKRIEGAGKLLLAIVNDVLDFSKIDAGRLTLEQAPFRLDDILDNLSNLLRNRIQEKKLLLEYIVAPDVPQALNGDALRLSQILINLLGNAIKFTAKGSVILSISAGPPVDGRIELEFRIQDTGIGMSQEEIDCLFHAFTQADSSVTRKFGGSGLGLVISKRLIEMMEGKIWVDSQPGQGSTFSFRIRLGLDDNIAAAGNYPGYRVLVVDDNPLARSVLEGLLQKRGCSVMTADSGAVALSLMRDPAVLPFACVMVDLNMPDMDGLELAQHIRAERARTPKLVLVTGENIHASQYRGTLGDFSAVMEKPVTSARIAEVLASLNGKPPATEESLPPASAAGQLSGLRILVAEDVPTNQMLMRDLLESFGATVDIVDNGQLAVQHLQSNGKHIDLVLMDIQMPEMDGLEACRRIRAGTVCAGIPIIALTANAQVEERLRALTAGMNDFLTKPIEPIQMIATIERWRPKPPSAAIPTRVSPSPVMANAPLFPELPGINVAEGLHRMLNRPALYEKVLRDFHSRFIDETTQIRNLLATADMETAARRAHSLKGTGGTIGAVKLAELSRALEQAINARSSEIPSCLEQCDRELNRILSGIAAHFSIQKE